MKYNPQKLEKKWQSFWEKDKTFKTDYPSKRPKFYCLDMFPYPSGSGLHVGHPRGYIASDIISRFKKMKGFNLLHPMGWDAFGLPAENHALKTGTQPQVSTNKNIKRFKEQLNTLGLSYDWSREINTTDPKYYQWTQWIFLQLFKKGLAYESFLPINWCSSCKTGLANEEVVDDGCERCDTEVGKKYLRQWVLKITDYADRLLKDLESLDWPENIKEMQRNWIGRSEGWEIKFPISNSQFLVSVFTTRPDTIFGVTFLVLSPEHFLIEEIKKSVQNEKEIDVYVKKAKEKSDIERTDLGKYKTGIKIEGVSAINPASGEKMPIWVADYVLSSYGSGAVMSVPAHDKRDYEFAKKYGCEIKEVISGGNTSKEAYMAEGVLINSGSFNGLSSEEAKDKIAEWLKEKKIASPTVNYKLRDWVFSRQRYWGEPIPLVFCTECKKQAEISNSKSLISKQKGKVRFNKGELLNPGWIALSAKDLPLKLPEVEKYQPTGTGESPLALVKNWVEVKCPKCGGEARRETNTMPQWAGSCWYYLRYIDSENEKELIDFQKEKYFMPVDLYIGGAEHAVLHLLYARFWHKFLYDIGKVSTKEPFQKLKNQGLILDEKGKKMSKSKGNVISPDEIIKEYGADTLRLYEMFIGPFDEPAIWNTKGIIGARRFLEKVWKIKTKEGGENDQLLQQTIKKVTEDLEGFKFNTAISALMILINEWSKKDVSREDFGNFIKILYSFAPHICEELWASLGNKKSLYLESWPKYDRDFAKKETVTFIIQVNGKVRDKIETERGIDEKKLLAKALSNEKIKKWTMDKKIKKTIFVKDKLINIVIEP